MKTKHQLAQIMVRREIPEEIFLPLLDRFEESGLINDRAFAETFVAARRASKGLSRSALRRELKAKGVDADVIEQSLEELTKVDELETAIAFAAKKLRSMNGLDPQVKRRRLSGFLQRKGYSSNIVFAAIKHAETHEVN